MRSTARVPTAGILLPTDFERPAQRAFVYALNLARVLKARVKILHVIKAPPDMSEPPSDSRYLNVLKTSALLHLGRLARLAMESGAPADPQLAFGAPDACILEAVTEMQPTFIVMGTEGREGWDRLRLGSTAHSVIRQAPCPVLAVHGGLGGDAIRRPARVRFERLLFATDFSPWAEGARRVVSRLARLTNGKVCIVHVAAKEPAVKEGQHKLNPLIGKLRRQRIEAEGVCLSGEPIEALLGQAARWEADMIAVGTQGRRGLPRVLLGSVAEGVLRRAGCPVLVVKNAELPAGMKGRQRRRHRS